MISAVVVVVMRDRYATDSYCNLFPVCTKYSSHVTSGSFQALHFMFRCVNSRGHSIIYLVTTMQSVAIVADFTSLPRVWSLIQFVGWFFFFYQQAQFNESVFSVADFRRRYSLFNIRTIVQQLFTTQMPAWIIEVMPMHTDASIARFCPYFTHLG